MTAVRSPTVKVEWAIESIGEKQRAPVKKSASKNLDRARCHRYQLFMPTGNLGINRSALGYGKGTATGQWRDPASIPVQG